MLTLGKLFKLPLALGKVQRAFHLRMSANNYFAWIDLEMTGLDVNCQHIIEIACIVTRPDLTRIGNGIHLVVYQPEEVHDNSSQWSLKQHKESGLRYESINSDVSIQDADIKVSEYIEHCKYPTAKAKVYLAGNSIYMDKLFIEKYMPLVDSLLQYQLLDVSSIKLLYENWCGKIFPKSSNHRALDDVENSIKELEFYKENFFKNNLELFCSK